MLKLHKAGKSLRQIEDETSLSLRTVRTIVERENGTDRATRARHRRIETDKFERSRQKSRKRTGDALLKRVLGGDRDRPGAGAGSQGARTRRGDAAKENNSPAPL